MKTHYEELAALTLQLHHLEERWKMNNRMVNSLLDERMRIVSQLYAYDLTVDSSGNVIKTGDSHGE